MTEYVEWCDVCERDTCTEKPGLYRRFCSECGTDHTDR